MEDKSSQHNSQIIEKQLRASMYRVTTGYNREPHTLEDLFRKMTEMYARSLQEADNWYLINHSHGNAIRRHLDVFKRYISYLPRDGKILDWGCNHAPDAVMIKFMFGERFDLYGCDFSEYSRHAMWRDYAELTYTELDHVFRLPYEDRYFDVVIGSGVLEHAALYYESLKELYRIMKTDAVLIISFLPNKVSLSEFVMRQVGGGHRRVYGLKEIKRTLRDFGFEPVYAAYHQVLPSKRGQRILRKMWYINAALERIWPINMLSSNIMIIGQKRAAI